MTEHLTNPEEKIGEYRDAARRAEQSANDANDPDVRQAYIQIMRTWIYLAEELEREIGIADHGHSEDEHPDEIFVPRRVDRYTYKSH
jgi:hypothetical protein